MKEASAFTILQLAACHFQAGTSVGVTSGFHSKPNGDAL
jgi:hypothetical protein